MNHTTSSSTMNNPHQPASATEGAEDPAASEQATPDAAAPASSRTTSDGAEGHPPHLAASPFLNPDDRFPLDVLPPPLQNYGQALARALGVPVAPVLGLMAPVAGACLGNMLVVRVNNTWEEWPTRWTLLVGESGSKKSPILENVTRPVHLFSGVPVEGLRGYRYGGDPPKRGDGRWVIGDTTTEAIMLTHENSPTGLVMIVDEASSWISSMDRYARGEGDLQTWIKLQGHAPLVVDRKTGISSIKVDRPSVSVIGATQPETLKRVLSDASFTTGFAARLHLVELPSLPPTRGTADSVPPEVEQEYVELVRDLLAWRYGQKEPLTLALTPEAEDCFLDFKFEAETAVHEMDEGPLRYMVAKVAGACLATAGTLEAAWAVAEGRPKGPISLSVMKRAILLSRWQLKSTAAVLEQMGVPSRPWKKAVPALHIMHQILQRLPDTFTAAQFDAEAVAHTGMQLDPRTYRTWRRVLLEEGSIERLSGAGSFRKVLIR